MTNVTQDWFGDAQLPDEEELKAQWEAEIAAVEAAAEAEERWSERRREQMQPLLDGLGLDWDDLEELQRNDAEVSREITARSDDAFEGDGRDLPDELPPLVTEGGRLDPDAFRAAAERLPGSGEMVAMSHDWTVRDGGRETHPDGGGGHWWRNGEGEEKPGWNFDFGDRVLEAKVNARGEGLGDSDHSKIHLYFTYEFTPEASGSLHLHLAGGHVGGERSWWANDAWYNSEEVEFSVETTLDVHQGLWKRDQSTQLLGGETTDVGSGRISPFYEHADMAHAARVTDGATVTVKVGLTLYARAEAAGTHCIVDCTDKRAGDGFHVPPLDWYVI
jgi:hypothetical protein